MFLKYLIYKILKMGCLYTKNEVKNSFIIVTFTPRTEYEIISFPILLQYELPNSDNNIIGTKYIIVNTIRYNIYYNWQSIAEWINELREISFNSKSF